LLLYALQDLMARAVAMDVVCPGHMDLPHGIRDQGVTTRCHPLVPVVSGP
jgi:hypothetical protein